MFVTTSSWRRPWRELIRPTRLFSRPRTFGEAMRRIKYNLGYFRANYGVLAFFNLFVSVLFHREARFFFVIFRFIWFIFYFIVEDPCQFEVWNQTINGRLLLEVLLTLSTVALLYAELWLNVLVSFSVSFGLVGLHTAFRGLEVLPSQDQEAATAAPYLICYIPTSITVHVYFARLRQLPELLKPIPSTSPATLGEATARIKHNLSYFRSTYAMFVVDFNRTVELSVTGSSPFFSAPFQRLAVCVALDLDQLYDCSNSRRVEGNIDSSLSDLQEVDGNEDDDELPLSSLPDLVVSIQ
ncbi:hypothetical protein FNV43_RR23301 [Rhamnella rubrinervis]|uniref:PRA1 family protein n=1 Tax=Rhamnella rubrinervis TaxID=2594499 RepID=A0A8K0GRY1_9ROSA|nr:hypothetical protein FNV43_RR23301 [Rhamnella rubrinervis]